MLSGLSNILQPVYPSSLRTGAEVERRLPEEHGYYSRGCRVILQIRIEESQNGNRKVVAPRKGTPQEDCSTTSAKLSENKNEYKLFYK
jgi:hypothetical protein